MKARFNLLLNIMIAIGVGFLSYDAFIMINTFIPTDEINVFQKYLALFGVGASLLYCFFDIVIPDICKDIRRILNEIIQNY